MYISDSEINEQENFCKSFYNILYQIFKSGNIKGIFDEETSSNEFTFKIIPEIDEIMTIKNVISNVSSKNSFKSYVLTKINTPNINACIKVQNRISENDKPYLTIMIFTSHSIGIDWNNTNNIKLKMYNPYRNIIIHENKSIYSSTKNHKYFPISASDLEHYLPDEVKRELFLLHSEKTYFWKDMIQDNFYPPIKLTDISKYHNKKEYFEKLFKIELPSSINKRNSKAIYYLCCAAKYINQNQLNILFNSDFDDIAESELSEDRIKLSIRNRKEIGQRCLYHIMRNRNPNISKDTLIDYLDMAVELKEPVDITAGKKKIYKLHDEYVHRYIAKANRGIKFVIPETPLKYLELPEPFYLIKTKSALQLEGEINDNCVGTYLQKINDGHCIIYTADIDEQHLTIDIRYNKTSKKFSVNQCYKKHNQPCKEETLEYVKKTVQEHSKQAITMYQKRNKKSKK